eukprot:358706-Chlamydomonas_euryale.AAC.1
MHAAVPALHLPTSLNATADAPNAHRIASQLPVGAAGVGSAGAAAGAGSAGAAAGAGKLAPARSVVEGRLDKQTASMTCEDVRVQEQLSHA